VCECYFVFLLRRARTHPGRTRARAPPVTSRPPSVSPRSRSLLPHTHRGDRHQFYTERGYWYYTVYLSRTIPLRHQCDYRLHIQRCRVVGTTVVIFSLSHTHARAPGRIASFSVVFRHQTAHIPSIVFRNKSTLSVASDRHIPTARHVSLTRYEEERR